MIGSITRLFAGAGDITFVTGRSDEHCRLPQEATRPPPPPKTRAKLGRIFGAYFQTLLLTAQRRGEVATMRWEDLDFAAAVWTIPYAKGGHAHEVPLSRAVVALLRTIPQLEQCPYVFSTNGRTAISGFSKATALSTELSDVTGWRVHDLRRSAATHMAELQIPKATIRRVLGHTESDVTETYVRRSWINEKRSALDTWAAFLTKRVRRAKSSRRSADP